MDLNAWVDDVTGQASARAISGRLNRSHTAVAKWLRAGEMPCQVIIEIARAYEGDPIEGLLAGGYLLCDEVSEKGMRALAKNMPSMVLVDELTTRFRFYEGAHRKGRAKAR